MGPVPGAAGLLATGCSGDSPRQRCPAGPAGGEGRGTRVFPSDPYPGAPQETRVRSSRSFPAFAGAWGEGGSGARPGGGAGAEERRLWHPLVGAGGPAPAGGPSRRREALAIGQAWVPRPTRAAR